MAARAAGRAGEPLLRAKVVTFASTTGPVCCMLDEAFKNH